MRGTEFILLLTYYTREIQHKNIRIHTKYCFLYFIIPLENEKQCGAKDCILSIREKIIFNVKKTVFMFSMVENIF